jgi:hypothetical protein
MNIIDKIKNNTVFLNKYKTDSEAVIISCFFNPQRSKYRTAAFNKFYNDIKHLNHLIIEGVISSSTPELTESNNIKHVKTESHLWHKEGLLNYAVSILPKKYKYIFPNLKMLNTDTVVTRGLPYISKMDERSDCHMIDA